MKNQLYTKFAACTEVFTIKSLTPYYASIVMSIELSSFAAILIEMFPHDMSLLRCLLPTDSYDLLASTGDLREPSEAKKSPARKESADGQVCTKDASVSRDVTAAKWRIYWNP